MLWTLFPARGLCLPDSDSSASALYGTCGGNNGVGLGLTDNVCGLRDVKEVRHPIRGG
eukprot:SAG22_NODE_13774_length_395_cov_0.932432_1_plen_57_part_10